jgi:glucose/mannose-6-phosphate isomerase
MEIKDLEKVDTKCMYKTYDNWPEIAEDAFRREFDKIDVKDIDHIVFAGMGGSGSIGDTIGSILSQKDIHVSIVKGYLLPKTVDSNTLVIATSVSGNTIETLEILKNVGKTSAKAIGFSSGGNMKKFCQSNSDIFFQEIPMIHSPRASFTNFLYSILNILEPILQIEQNEILESISSLKITKKQVFSGNLSEDNDSLSLAKFTKDLVSIYHPAGLRAAAIRYKNCLQENAKMHAMTEDVIESCHNGIVSWERDSEVKPVLVQGKNDRKDTTERWKILEEYFMMKDIKYKVVNSNNENILSKIVNLSYMLDYSTIYTAIINNTDPSPVRSIDFVKSKL